MAILRFPLVRIAACFIPGIAAAYYIKPSILLLSVTAGCFLILSCAAYCFARRQFKQRLYFGISFYILVFCCGAATQAVHAFYNQRGHYFNGTDFKKAHSIALILNERLKNSQSGSRYVADMASVDGKRSTGKILLHFKGQRERLPIGTKILVRGKIIPNRRPGNPGQFDYGKYLDDKSIPAQLYLADGNHKLYGVAKNLGYYADAVRYRIIATLRNNDFNETELQVLHALILGQQQEIAPDIVRDYQFAGAVHILSVSGLHVGFVLLFVNFILKPLPKSRRWNLTRLCIVLSSLWGFAFIAGLSPSVIRSAAMFSFVAIGMHLGRSTNIFHTLVVSLLLILLFQPAFLFDVGFQLSYAALLFILWLQPPLSRIWKPENRVVRYFWEILTVSFAAQIGTLPLSIYYFHQFPALFFVTNIVVIPMLSAIMAVGIAVVLPAIFGYAVPFLCDGLECGIAILNRIIGAIASLESFVLTGIPCNLLLMVLAYASIVAVTLWLRKPSGSRLLAAVSVLLVFQASTMATIRTSRSQAEFIVCNLPKSTLLIEREGQSATAFGKHHPIIDTYAVAHFAKTQTAPLRNVFWFSGKKILLLDKAGIPEVAADIVILSRSPKINLDRWLQTCNPKAVVADASNYKNDVRLWEATCRKQKIPFHYTNEKGFFRLGTDPDFSPE